MTTIDVWICTIGDAETVRPILSALAKSVQIANHDFSLNVVVVFNGVSQAVESEPRLVASYSSSGFTLSVLDSEKYDLSRARNTALEASSSEFGIFIDDDVEIPEDFVTELYLSVLNCKLHHARLFGGRITLLNVPENIDPIHAVYLSELNYEKPNRILKTEFINGACFGLDVSWVREHNLNFNTNLGRKGSILLSGEESLLISEVRSKGGTIWYQHDLQVFHKVDKGRLTSNWLAKRLAWEAVTQSIIHDLQTTSYGETLRESDYVVPKVGVVHEILRNTQLFGRYLSGDFNAKSRTSPLPSLRARHYAWKIVKWITKYSRKR